MSEHAHDHAHGANHAHDHGIKPYLMVFGALMILTVITVGLSYVDLGHYGNKIAGVLVASVKATLVVLIFMHMREDGAKDRYLIVSIVFPLCLFVLMACACIPDVVARGGDAANKWSTTDPAEGPGPRATEQSHEGHGHGSHEGHGH
jgi:cytochrome c oxidase subunit 4